MQLRTEDADAILVETVPGDAPERKFAPTDLIILPTLMTPDVLQVIKDAVPLFTERVQSVERLTTQTLINLAIACVKETARQSMSEPEVAAFVRTNRALLQKTFEPIIDGLYLAYIRGHGRRATLNAGHTLLKTYGLPFVGGMAYPRMPDYESDKVGSNGWVFVPDKHSGIPAPVLKRYMGMWGVLLRDEDLSVFQ